MKMKGAEPPWKQSVYLNIIAHIPATSACYQTMLFSCVTYLQAAPNHRCCSPHPPVTCSSGVAQDGAAPSDQRPAVHQLHPGGPDAAHQQGLLGGQGGFLQGAGGDQQELAQRREQGQDGRREFTLSLSKP